MIKHRLTIKDEQKLKEAIIELDSYIDFGGLNHKNVEVRKLRKYNPYRFGYRCKVKTNNFIISAEIWAGWYGTPAYMIVEVRDKKSEELVYEEVAIHALGEISKYGAMLSDRLICIIMYVERNKIKFALMKVRDSINRYVEKIKDRAERLARILYHN
jgi:hypothetical protein